MGDRIIGTQPSDILWVLLGAVLVFVMQPGFMCLESGLTRSKNAINVAIKNITDFGLSVFLFWALGFALMFGTSQSGWFGTSHFLLEIGSGRTSLAVFFVFQAMFCGTATTIVSGAVAERMRFRGYLLVAVILSALIYPLFGHWSWSGLDGTAGWLRAMGFRDFAGSSVVHSIGGWVALAAVLVIGPRHGRFPPGEPPQSIPGQSLPMAVLGTLLLWMGWFGFNGGSTLALNDAVPRVIINTMLSGVAGLLTSLLISWWIHGRPAVQFVMNGALAGLVAITAGCNAVDTKSAVVIGAMGAAVMIGMSHLLQRLRVDDVVDAISVHAGAGVWGTVAVAIFGQTELLSSGLNRWQQIGVQLVGSVVCFVWAFGLSYLLFRLLNRFMPLRVTAEDEHVGLNVAEHGATTEILDLLTVMDQQAKTGDLSQRVRVEPFTEVGQIATLYNRVIDALQQAEAKQIAFANELQRSNADLESFAFAASHDLHEPLRGIKGLSQVLEKETAGKLSDKAAGYLQLIIEGATRMQSLINDLLEYSRVSTQAESFQPTNCNDVVESTLGLLRVAIEDSAATVRYEPLPIIQADVRQLRQLFQNLIGNAIKYRGGVPPEINITSEQLEKEWLFSVRDNGIGIDPKFHERVFEIFQRLHHREEFEGTGIGLALCKRIVERHGGRMWVEPAPARGSVFCFTIPVVAVDSQ